jgi:decaprenyl-phosphate phosphoribosyltransferase
MPLHGMKIQDLLKTLRPAHWVKNLLVLAPLFFSGEAFPFRLRELKHEFLAFAGFCCAASLIYIINDAKDAEQDRADPLKSRRPYASGRISAAAMTEMGVALAAAAAACSVFLGAGYTAIVAAYVAVMLLYSWSLKRYALTGVAIIAGGMILRIHAGAVAIGVEVSVWVYPAAFLLAFYVVAGKRFYGEAAQGAKEPARYQDWVFRAAGAGAFIVYAVYCFSGVGRQKYHTGYLWATAPFVGVAIWRYASVARRAVPGKEHLQAILSDSVIVCSVLAWLFVFTALIYAKAVM